MKTKININGKDVEITLTAQQVDEIKKASMKITDRVKTFSDACEVVGVSENQKIILNLNTTDKETKAAQAYTKLQIIAKALNEGWFPDWNNSNEVKYWPWLEWKKSGAGFSFNVCDFVYSHSSVGSRLCFKTRALAEYAGQQFTDIYNDFFN